MPRAGVGVTARRATRGPALRLSDTVGFVVPSDDDLCGHASTHHAVGESRLIEVVGRAEIINDDAVERRLEFGDHCRGGVTIEEYFRGKDDGSCVAGHRDTVRAFTSTARQEPLR